MGSKRKKRESVIPLPFWYFSLLGGITLFIYAFSKKDPKTGEIIFPELELVRLTVSRRVYTNRHMDVVVNSLADVYQRRNEMKGLRITYQGPIISLRHFTAKFEMIA